MNTNRRLFILFPCSKNAEPIQGYTCIHKHTFPNDEPPYIMVSYWGITGSTSFHYEEDYETYSYYYMRTSDVKDFIALNNENQREYEGMYLEGIMTRNHGEHDMNPREYASQADWIRAPKTKVIFDTPRSIS